MALMAGNEEPIQDGRKKGDGKMDMAVQKAGTEASTKEHGVNVGEAGRLEKVFRQVFDLRNEIEREIQAFSDQLSKGKVHDQDNVRNEEEMKSQQQALEKVLKRLEQMMAEYPVNESGNETSEKTDLAFPTTKAATVVVTLTRSVTLDVPAGTDEHAIKEMAAEQFNSLDPEDREMLPQHASIIDIDYSESTDKPSVIRLSELTSKDEWRDEVENFLFQCLDAKLLIDAGFYLEVYTNPDGVFEDEQSSNGASTFVWIDEDTLFGELLDVFEDMGRIRDQTLTVSVIPAVDEIYAKEREFAKRNPISSLKKDRVLM